MVLAGVILAGILLEVERRNECNDGRAGACIRDEDEEGL